MSASAARNRSCGYVTGSSPRRRRQNASFIPDSAGASLTALVTNLKSAPSKAFHLSFEFLDARGQVVATVTQDVPSLPPQQSQEIDLKAAGKGIAGWRYRAS